ncbi:hypothetical protein ACXGSF_00420 [Limosilactobacillus mucosae]
MNSIMIFGIVLICCVMLWARISFDLSNPLFFLWSTWIISFVICVGNIFQAYSKLSLKTIMFIFICLLMVTIGFHLGKRVKITCKLKKYNTKVLVNSFNILTILVIGAFLATIYIKGLPPVLSSENIQRSDYYLNNGGELVYLLMYPANYLGIYLLKIVNKRKIVPQLLILWIIAILRGNKMTIFAIILIWLFLYGKKVYLEKILLLLGIIIVIFYVASYIYTKNISNLSVFKIERMNVVGFSLATSFYFLFDLMVYLSTNIFNLNGLIMMNLGGIGLGTQSFKGVSQVFSAFVPKISEYSNNISNVMSQTLQVSSFNTYSALGLLYVDFGILLSIVIMFIIGAISGTLFSYHREFNSNIGVNFIGFCFYQTLALSFFSFYIGNLEVISNIIVMLVINYLAVEKKID